MSSRNLELTVTIAITFFILFVFGISCDSSYGQADRAARRAGAGSATQENIRETYRQLLEKMQEEGYDVSEAKALGDRARLAAREGNRQEAQKLLTKAVEKLKALESKSPDGPQPSGESKTGKTGLIELSVGSSQVYVTQSVPSATSGDKVESYQRAFKSETLTAKNGKVSLSLTTTPVFIEQMDKSDKKIHTSPGDSPFGISSPGFLADKDYRYWLSVIKQAGAETVRFISRPEWGGMVWDLIETEKGKFDWSKTDARYLAAKELGLNIVVNMYPVSQWDAPDIKELNLKYYSKFPGHYPNDMQEYLKFVTLAAERYDGDGVGDAPGSPKVGVWILGAEMEMVGRWEGTPEEYARLFVKTYDAIINANPSAKVWIYGSNTYRFILDRKDGGVSRIEKFIEPMLKELAKFKSSLPEPPLIYPIHCYQHHRTDLVKEFSDELSAVEAEVDRMLKKSGFGDYAIVISDFGVFPCYCRSPERTDRGQ